jgi:uncharacterized protein Yka (UPF0111/DUF47 family)
MSSLKDKMRSEGIKFGMKAMSKVMESPDRAQKVMQAVETVQRSSERLEETAGRIRNLSQLPSREDVRELGRYAGRLRRQVRKMMSEVKKLDKALDKLD